MIQRFINQIYFLAFCWELEIHRIFNSINPLIWFMKSDYAKNRLKRKWGIENWMEDYNNVFENEKNGLSMIKVDYVLIIFFGWISIAISLRCVYHVLIDYGASNYLFWAFMLTFLLTVYFFVWRKDKYITYFREYKKWSVKKLKRRMLIYAIFFIGLLILTFLSFVI